MDLNSLRKWFFSLYLRHSRGQAATISGERGKALRTRQTSHPKEKMAIKKSEIYSSLWKSCDELRGGMDASQYKDYVLVLLFVKYVSDKYAGQKDAMVEVPKGGSFADVVALKGNKEIGDKINKIIAKLAEVNNLKGVIDQTDFNDPPRTSG